MAAIAAVRTLETVIAGCRDAYAVLHVFDSESSCWRVSTRRGKITPSLEEHPAQKQTFPLLVLSFRSFSVVFLVVAVLATNRCDELYLSLPRSPVRRYLNPTRARVCFGV